MTSQVSLFGATVVKCRDSNISWDQRPWNMRSACVLLLAGKHHKPFTGSYHCKVSHSSNSGCFYPCVLWKQSLYTPWRRLGERRYNSYSFSTSAVDGGEWSASRPGRAFTPGERTPGPHCAGGWVGLRAGLDTEDRGKILCPRRGSNPDRSVVQPVVRHYCMSYPCSN
jgi:hypothetical protein